MLNSPKKAIHATNILAKVIKGNSNFFAEQICAYFNESISDLKFDSFYPLSEDIDGFFKANVKYRKQPRVVTVTVSEFTKEWFSFNTITVEELFE